MRTGHPPPRRRVRPPVPNRSSRCVARRQPVGVVGGQGRSDRFAAGAGAGPGIRAGGLQYVEPSGVEHTGVRGRGPLSPDCGGCGRAGSVVGGLCAPARSTAPGPGRHTLGAGAMRNPAGETAQGRRPHTYHCAQGLVVVLVGLPLPGRVYGRCGCALPRSHTRTARVIGSPPPQYSHRRPPGNTRAPPDGPATPPPCQHPESGSAKRQNASISVSIQPVIGPADRSGRTNRPLRDHSIESVELVSDAGWMRYG